MKRVRVAHGKGEHAKTALWKRVFPFYGENFRLGFWSKHFDPGIPSGRRGGPGHWAYPRRSAFCTDCGLTKHYRPDGFRMVLPAGPTAKSLGFLTVYHCECLTYLPAGVQLVYNNLIPGRQRPGLLALRGSSCHVWATYVCKRKSNGNMWDLFLTNLRGRWLGQVTPRRIPASLRQMSKGRLFTPCQRCPCSEMQSPLRPRPQTASLPMDRPTKQARPGPSKKPWIPPPSPNRAFANVPLF